MRLTTLFPAGALVLAAFVLAGCPVTIVERAVAPTGLGGGNPIL